MHILWGKKITFLLDYQKKIAGLLAAWEVLAVTSIPDVAGVPCLPSALVFCCFGWRPSCAVPVASFRIYCCGRQTCFATRPCFCKRPWFCCWLCYLRPSLPLRLVLLASLRSSLPACVGGTASVFVVAGVPSLLLFGTLSIANMPSCRYPCYSWRSASCCVHALAFCWKILMLWHIQTKFGFWSVQFFEVSLSDVELLNMLILDKAGFICNILLYPRRSPGIETKNRILR